MSTDNLLSGLIGSILGVILTVIFSHFARAIKLNKTRISVVRYLRNVVMPQVEWWISDSKIAMEKLSNPSDKEVKAFTKLAPVTSQFFKAIDRTHLYDMAYSSETFLNLEVLCSYIDILKEGLPLKYLHRLRTKEFANVFDEEEQKLYLSINLAQDVKTAVATISLCSTAIEKLEGNKTIWLFKYLRFW